MSQKEIAQTLNKNGLLQESQWKYFPMYWIFCMQYYIYFVLPDVIFRTFAKSIYRLEYDRKILFWILQNPRADEPICFI